MTHEANKKGKVSEITASTEILKHTIHASTKDEDDPE